MISVQDEADHDAADEAAILVMTPGGAEAILNELQVTMEGLIAVIEEETRLIRSGALLKAAEMEAEKSRLSGAYMRVRSRVKANAVALARHAPDAVQAMRGRHEEFAALLRVNLAVLATAREVAEDIVRNVSVAVGRHTAPKTYGQHPGQAANAYAGARGIAVDRSL
jgi:hypothetical protein